MLKDLIEIPSSEIRKVVASMETKASELGLPFGGPERLFNTRLAQEMGVWAELEGKGDEYHNIAFKAYFADGKNLAEKHVLIQLAESAGLSPDKADHVIEKRLFKTNVDKDWSSSQNLGIKAIPTFLLGHDRMVGAQPYDKLITLMEKNAVRKQH